MKRNLPFSIPQGSCAGAQLFKLFCSTIQEIVSPPLTLHGFADDHVVRNKFRPGDWREEARCMSELEKFAADLKFLMNKNRLKMNNDKTEFNLFGSEPQLDKCKTKTLNVNNTEIKLADKKKISGCLIRPEAQFEKAHNIKTSNCNGQHSTYQEHQALIDPESYRNSSPRDNNVTSGLLQ